MTLDVFDWPRLSLDSSDDSGHVWYWLWPGLGVPILTLTLAVMAPGGTWLRLTRLALTGFRWAWFALP